MASRHLMCLLPIPSNTHTHTHQILKKGNRRGNVARSASSECDYQFLSVGDDFWCLAGRSNLIPFFSYDHSPLNLCFYFLLKYPDQFTPISINFIIFKINNYINI